MVRQRGGHRVGCPTYDTPRSATRSASLAVSAGAKVKVRMLGHYASDLVKCFLSGDGLIELGEQPVEHFLAAEPSSFSAAFSRWAGSIGRNSMVV